LADYLTAKKKTQSDTKEYRFNFLFLIGTVRTKSHAELVSAPHTLSLCATSNPAIGCPYADYLCDEVLKQVQHDLLFIPAIRRLTKFLNGEALNEAIEKQTTPG
jgi:hypothetical protein